MKRLLLAILALPISAFAQGGLPNEPYIYVEGQAEIEKPPELVTLRFDLVARDADQAKANQEVQAKATKILALLDERKLAQKDVVATDVRSEPEYEREEDGIGKRGKIVNYRVTRSFSAKVRDIAIYPKLVDELLATAGVEFSGIESGLTNEKELNDAVSAKAIANAREQAEKALKNIGMKIDSVYALSPVAFPEIGQKLFGSADRVVVTGSYLRTQEPLDPTKYRLEPIKVSQTVHILYLISSAR